MRRVATSNVYEKENAMRRLVASSAVALLAVASVAWAADKVKSGLQVGESPGAFSVKDCTGPNDGRTLCYR